MKRKLAKGTRPEESRRQDGEGAVEWNSTIRSRNIGLAAKERDGREAPSSKHPFSNRLRGSLRSGDTDGTHANEKGGEK